MLSRSARISRVLRAAFFPLLAIFALTDARVSRLADPCNGACNGARYDFQCRSLSTEIPVDAKRGGYVCRLQSEGCTCTGGAGLAASDLDSNREEPEVNPDVGSKNPTLRSGASSDGCGGVCRGLRYDIQCRAFTGEISAEAQSKGYSCVPQVSTGVQAPCLCQGPNGIEERGRALQLERNPKPEPHTAQKGTPISDACGGVCRGSLYDLQCKALTIGISAEARASGARCEPQFSAGFKSMCLCQT